MRRRGVVLQMTRFFHAGPILLLLAATLGGCASYDYRVLQPPSVAGATATKQDFTEVDLDPLVYRLRVKDNRLVVLIFNPTGDPIRLLGEQSVVVDPNGQSHPVQGQTIAPGSYGKLILPPPTPRYPGYGPGFDGPAFYGPGLGIGLGTTIGRATGPPPLVQTALFANGGAESYQVIDTGNNYYWDWKGESTARLTLVYRRGAGGSNFTHEFTLGREKVK